MKSNLDLTNTVETDLDSGVNKEINENLAYPAKNGAKRRMRKNKSIGKKAKKNKTKGKKKQRKKLTMSQKKKNMRGKKGKKKLGQTGFKNRNGKKVKKNKTKGKKTNRKKLNMNKKQNNLGKKGKKKLRKTDCSPCIVNLWKYRDVMVKLSTYEKQFKRIKKFKNLGGMYRESRTKVN